MKDITSREDIDLLVKQFYLKVRQNETLGFIFGKKAELAKKRAHGIGQIMQLKMQQVNET